MKKEEILVSIIIPVYNTEKYLNKCLYSLVNQTLSDIEILIINDGSPDNSQQIIEEYVKKYTNKVFSYQKENGGLGSARNFGLEFVKGEYIGFIDSDDYVKPDMFEKMYNKAKAENADLVICEFDFVDEIGNYITSTQINGYKDLLITDKCYAHKYGRTEAFNKLYHRDLFFNSGIRYPKGWFEDFGTTPLLIEAANKIAYVNEPQMYYVQRNGSIMSQTKQFTDKYFDTLRMTEIIIKNKNIFQPENYKFYMQQVAPVHFFLKYFLSILKIKNEKKKVEIIKKWGEELNRLVPYWYKSIAIKNKLRSMTIFKRLVMKFAIYSFRFSKPFLIKKLKF